jgi:hypothetical protein
VAAGQAASAITDPHQKLLATKPAWSTEKLPGEALLLAIFATRQLLHGPYDTLIERIADIEHGIRVVDTAAAVVIKWVWEEIKNGEPTYRKISWTSFWGALILLAWAFGSLFFDRTDTPKDRAIKLHCQGQPTPPLPAQGKAGLDCNISVPG